MNRFFIVFLFSVLLSVSVKSQVTINLDDYVLTGNVGDSLWFHFTGTTNIDVGQLGENVWDFSNLSVKNTYLAMFIDPAESPFTDLYPEAEHCLHVREGETDLWLYSTAGDDKILAYGESIGEPGDGLSFIFKPERGMTFPLNYLDSWDYNGVETTIIGPVEDDTPITIQNVVDAYGKLTLPGGKVVDALRYTAVESRDFGGSTEESKLIFFLTKGGDLIMIFVLHGSPVYGETIAAELVWFANPVVVNVESDTPPLNYSLNQNYPNPFNPSTSIKYTIPEAGYVKLIIYDAAGREVVKLADGYRKAGTYNEKFDGKNLSSGIYFARFTCGDFSKTIKMTLLK